MIVKVQIFDELCQTLGYVIEQLCAGSQHQTLRYGVYFALHIEIQTVQGDQQYPEVRATKVQSQEISRFWNSIIKSDRISQSTS